jgi:CheY-like chemotaxis protein
MPSHPVEQPAIARTSSVLRILLVEDHADTLRSMSRLLNGPTCHVCGAASMAEALRLADRQPFDLVISDLGLPDASGLDLMRELQRRYHLPGIAVSGYGMETDIHQSRAAGFVQHLVKPVEVKALLAAIRHVSSGLELMLATPTVSLSSVLRGEGAGEGSGREYH